MALERPIRHLSKEGHNERPRTHQALQCSIASGYRCKRRRCFRPAAAVRPDRDKNRLPQERDKEDCLAIRNAVRHDIFHNDDARKLHPNPHLQTERPNIIRL